MARGVGGDGRKARACVTGARETREGCLGCEVSGRALMVQDLTISQLCHLQGRELGVSKLCMQCAFAVTNVRVPVAMHNRH